MSTSKGLILTDYHRILSNKTFLPFSITMDMQEKSKQVLCACGGKIEEMLKKITFEFVSLGMSELCMKSIWLNYTARIINIEKRIGRTSQ